MTIPFRTLCSYCQAVPALDGDTFCCDGCRTLSSVQKPAELTLIQGFGRAAGDRVRFECRVEPVACQACLQSLSRLNEIFPGLRDLQWNRDESVLSFELPRSETNPSLIFEHLRKLGLAPRWKTAEEPARSHQGARRDLLRLGITAALVGNLMIFAIPIYAGVQGSLRAIFEMIQGFLFLPILLWSARPFYRAAWMSFRHRQLSVDFPLVIAFLTGSFFSYRSLWAGDHGLYFDSLGGFLFLILVSRFLLERSLARYLRAPGLDQFFEDPVFKIRRHGQEFTQLWSQIKKDDQVILNRGARLPVDGVLISSSAEFETSWMNGEKVPQLRFHGARLDAGISLISDKAEILAVATTQETGFARLLKSLESAREKIRSTREATLGSLLVLACFVAVALLVAIRPDLGAHELARRAISLLIVACPCALSFGAPLARARAGQIALRWGFWARDPFAWDTLAKAKKIAFDKTGTLTGNLLQLAPNSPLIDAHLKQIILSLENISNHPVAQSIRRAWGALPLVKVEAAREIIGSGVEGRIGNDYYQIRSGSDENELMRIELFRNGKRVIGLNLEDAPVKGLSETWGPLASSHELFLISGDRTDRVHRFARLLGLPEDHAWGSLSPDQKLEKIKQIQPEIYFGDGTNDLLALQAVPVAIAVAEATLEAKAAADIMMLKPNLKQLSILFEIARETHRLVRRNLTLALAYNLLAGAAALAGLIQPLTAAVLMPLASVLLLASTLWGTGTLRKRAKG